MMEMSMLSAALLVSASAMAAKPIIPKELHGNWAESKAGCKIPKDSPIDFPDNGAKINATQITRYEYYCQLKAIKSKVANTYDVKLSCASEGETSIETNTLVLLPSGQLAGLVEKPLFHCK